MASAANHSLLTGDNSENSINEQLHQQAANREEENYDILNRAFNENEERDGAIQEDQPEDFNHLNNNDRRCIQVPKTRTVNFNPQPTVTNPVTATSTSH